MSAENSSPGEIDSETARWLLLESISTFQPDHPLRIRIEGAQSTTYEQLSSTNTQLASFNAASDKLYNSFSDNLSGYLTLLGQLKKDLQGLEVRVTAVKQRALKIAEVDGVNVDEILGSADN